ncbi:MAG TPA: DMT family transporter [Tepidisphaeraceae bacterium]|jgi:drug/metabolite transporter (DMT)-like permease
MNKSNPSSLVKSHLLLVLGVFACSLSVIFIKSSASHPYWLAGFRLLIAAAFLSPLVWREAKKDPAVLSGEIWLAAVPGALLLALHFISWTTGARMTTAVNGSLLVNLTTVVMPIVMWMMNRERINAGEIIGTLVALAGVTALIGGQVSVSAENALGDVICFVSMVLFCFYLAYARRNGAGQSLWLYLVPLYWIAGLICIAVALIAGAPLPPATAREAILLLCLGLVPTVIGHSIINWCINKLRSQTVATLNLCQVLFAGIAAYLVFNEPPSPWFIPVCAVVVLGSIITIRSHHKSVVDAES